MHPDREAQRYRRARNIARAAGSIAVAAVVMLSPHSGTARGATTTDATAGSIEIPNPIAPLPILSPPETPEPEPQAERQATTTTTSTAPAADAEPARPSLSPTPAPAPSSSPMPRVVRPQRQRPVLRNNASTTTQAPKASSTSAATSSPSASSSRTIASTTPAASVAAGSSGDANQYTPYDYYAPLDNLTPEETYGLSALAMLVGIVGTVMMLRDPRERAVRAWPSPLAGRSLQES